MSAEAILSYITGCSRMGRLEFQVCMQCAPVLKGVKISNIVTLQKKSWKILQPILKRCGIICIPLFTGEKTEVLLLYRYKGLARHLIGQKEQEFLAEQGYRRYDVASVIIELRNRYVAYAMGEQEFPHELGIVLEYPVEDVRGFMENQGERFLVSGYWKVYDNPVRALCTFSGYDRAREKAMQQIVDGYSLGEIIESER